jgi:hypothetical protein
MSAERKIKNFKDYSMQKPTYYKMLNKLVITGEHKYGFFSKKKPFEIIIYYTPLKGKIMDIFSNNSEIELPFKQGDNISIVREWYKFNNYHITLDKKKI